MAYNRAVTEESGFTVKHRDELERSGRSLARRSIGLKAFGMNVVDLEPGDRIPEHDETARDQEEVSSSSRATPRSSWTGEAPGAGGHLRARRPPASPDGRQHGRRGSERPHRLRADDERLRARHLE
jgi:hypothetical protein